MRRLAAAFRGSCSPIYHSKIVSRADEACAYSSSPGVWSLISAVVQPRHRARSRHYSSHYKVMLNWIAVVGVAQLVERRSVAPNVAGSNPVSHPNFTKFHFPFKSRAFVIVRKVCIFRTISEIQPQPLKEQNIFLVQKRVNPFRFEI